MEVRRTALVMFPAEAMFDLIEAAEHYPAFVPGCVAVQMLERTDDVVAARMTLRLAGVPFTLQTRNPKRRPHWMLVEMQPSASGSLLRRFRGEWNLTALNAQACRIDFTLTYELNGAAARVAQAAFDRMADRLVDAFVQRAERVLPAALAQAAAAAPSVESGAEGSSTSTSASTSTSTSTSTNSFTADFAGPREEQP